MLTRFSTNFEVVFVLLIKVLEEFSRVFTYHYDVINLDRNVLMMCIKVLAPDTRVSFAWRESHFAEIVGKAIVQLSDGDT
jgi:hypothetical protein